MLFNDSATENGSESYDRCSSAHSGSAALELVGDDPLSPESWKKRPTPILSANDTVKGAGHCSVICDDDAIRVFFHAWSADEEKISWDTVHSWHAVMKIDGDDITIE